MMAKIEARSEISGLVWKIVAKPGDRVAEGDPLMIVESMKMEISLLAGENATVKEIHVCEGDAVKEGQVVATLEN